MTVSTSHHADCARRLIVSAHCNLRGPFTAATEICLAVKDALTEHRETFVRHDTEILTVAPEYAQVLAATRATQTSAAVPQTRTRYYPPAWVTRLSHGLTEFVSELAAAGVLSELVVENAEHADPTDAEFLRILARRCSPHLSLQILDGAALREGATARHVMAEEDLLDSARRHVAADLVDTDSGDTTAYAALVEAERHRLHDERLAALHARIADGEVSLERWATVQHALAGSDPDGAGILALTVAIEQCVLAGFYDAVVDLGHQLMPMLDWESQTNECWLVTAKVTMALSALGRIDEAEQWYDQACAATTDPSTHLQAHYGRAMLYTRFRNPDVRDHHRARGLVKTAVTIAMLLPDRDARAFNSTFNENGLALVELHLGNLDEALRLVEGGMARLGDVPPEKATQHFTVLGHNRAQLLSGMGRPDDALTQMKAVIDEDPNHSEYYLDLASMLRQLGRTDEALAAIGEAIELGLPYPEPHYNRADLLIERGEHDAASADLRYVLELDPDFPNARVNLTELLLETGHLDEAGALAAADTSDPLLLTLRGQIAEAQADTAAAHQAYDAALSADSQCLPALVLRGILRYESGTVMGLRGSIEDLEDAVRLSDDPDLRENLQVARAAAAAMA